MTSLTQILSLARAGSPARAWALFVEAGWNDRDDNLKALTLKGRLLKDQAKAAARADNGRDQMRLYDEAAAAYELAAKIKPDSYPLINAASLALLSGKPKRARELASQIIELIENDPDEGENIYWRGATYAEALLLANKQVEARAALSDAISQLPDAWEDHAATLGQFSAILSEQGQKTDWLDRHRPPTSIYYSGIIRLTDESIVDAIDNYIETEKPAFAYGSLAAGGDILFAKSFLQYKDHYKPNAELHIILPFPTKQFCELSVEPFGVDWVADFEDILAKADSVHIMGLEDPPYQAAIMLADKVAMGQAIRNAHNLQSKVKAFTIKAAGEELRPILQEWQKEDYDLMILEAERPSNQKGEFSEPQNSAYIKALIWVQGNLPANLKALGGWQHQNGGFYRVFDSLMTAYNTTSENTNDDAHIALLYDILDQPDSEVLLRAEAMAKLSDTNIITCDYNSAMALQFENIDAQIEEIGALKLYSGVRPLWCIIA